MAKKKRHTAKKTTSHKKSHTARHTSRKHVSHKSTKRRHTNRKHASHKKHISKKNRIRRKMERNNRKAVKRNRHNFGRDFGNFMDAVFNPHHRNNDPIYNLHHKNKHHTHKHSHKHNHNHKHAHKSAKLSRIKSRNKSRDKNRSKNKRKQTTRSKSKELKQYKQAYNAIKSKKGAKAKAHKKAILSHIHKLQKSSKKKHVHKSASRKHVKKNKLSRKRRSLYNKHERWLKADQRKLKQYTAVYKKVKGKKAPQSKADAKTFLKKIHSLKKKIDIHKKYLKKHAPHKHHKRHTKNHKSHNIKHIRYNKHHHDKSKMHKTASRDKIKRHTGKKHSSKKHAGKKHPGKKRSIIHSAAKAGAIHVAHKIHSKTRKHKSASHMRSQGINPTSAELGKKSKAVKAKKTSAKRKHASKKHASKKHIAKKHVNKKHTAKKTNKMRSQGINPTSAELGETNSIAKSAPSVTQSAVESAAPATNSDTSISQNTLGNLNLANMTPIQRITVLAQALVTELQRDHVQLNNQQFVDPQTQTLANVNSYTDPNTNSTLSSANGRYYATQPFMTPNGNASQFYYNNYQDAYNAAHSADNMSMPNGQTWGQMGHSGLMIDLGKNGQLPVVLENGLGSQKQYENQRHIDVSVQQNTDNDHSLQEAAQNGHKSHLATINIDLVDPTLAGNTQQIANSSNELGN